MINYKNKKFDTDIVSNMINYNKLVEWQVSRGRNLAMFFILLLKSSNPTSRKRLQWYRNHDQKIWYKISTHL